jgi:hypothetical protein
MSERDATGKFIKANRASPGVNHVIPNVNI